MGLRIGRREFFHATNCLACLAIAGVRAVSLEGSEFSGGRLTGRLLEANYVGSALYILALFLTFFHSRASYLSAFTASLLCLPLYLYFVVPGVFRQIFPSEYAVPLQAFGWDLWSLAGALLTIVMCWPVASAFF